VVSCGFATVKENWFCPFPTVHVREASGESAANALSLRVWFGSETTGDP
jgi:hypothetical protein